MSNICASADQQHIHAMRERNALPVIDYSHLSCIVTRHLFLPPLLLCPAALLQVFLFHDRSLVLHSGLGRYFCRRLLCDITIVAPDGRQLPCHQILLAASSKRFADLLETGERCNAGHCPLLPLPHTPLHLLRYLRGQEWRCVTLSVCRCTRHRHSFVSPLAQTHCSPQKWCRPIRRDAARIQTLPVVLLHSVVTSSYLYRLCPQVRCTVKSCRCGAWTATPWKPSSSSFTPASAP